VRDAISLLDQLASTGDKIDLALTQTVLGTATSQTVLDLVASIQDNQPAPAMDAIHRALDSGADPRSLARQIVDYLRGLLLIQMGNDDQVDATQEVKATMAQHAKSFSTHDVLRMMKAFNAAATDTRGGWQPSLGLELALAEVLTSPAEAPVLKHEEKPAPAKAAKKEASAVTKAPKAEAASGPAPSEAVSKTEDAPPQKAAVTSLAQVVKAWRDIRSIIKPDYPALDGLLNSCKPLEIRGNELYLGFASQVLVKKMEQPEQIEVTCKAIAEVLGVDLSIKCVVANAKGQLPPDVNPDGMVAAAIQNGGEIVDMQD